MANLWISWDSLNEIVSLKCAYWLYPIDSRFFPSCWLFKQSKILSVSLAVAVATRNSANLLTQQSKFATKLLNEHVRGNIEIPFGFEVI